MSKKFRVTSRPLNPLQEHIISAKDADEAERIFDETFGPAEILSVLEIRKSTRSKDGSK